MGFAPIPQLCMRSGEADRWEVGRGLTNLAKNSHQPFRRRERAMQRFRNVQTLRQGNGDLKRRVKRSDISKPPLVRRAGTAAPRCRRHLARHRGRSFSPRLEPLRSALAKLDPAANCGPTAAAGGQKTLSLPRRRCPGWDGTLQRFTPDTHDGATSSRPRREP
jgi:hypothetical protein